MPDILLYYDIIYKIIKLGDTVETPTISSTHYSSIGGTCPHGYIPLQNSTLSSVMHKLLHNNICESVLSWIGVRVNEE